jgi:hypothetical protein
MILRGCGVTLQPPCSYFASAAFSRRAVGERLARALTQLSSHRMPPISTWGEGPMEIAHA